jgi:hypothetical protein
MRYSLRLNMKHGRTVYQIGLVVNIFLLAVKVWVLFIWRYLYGIDVGTGYEVSATVMNTVIINIMTNEIHLIAVESAEVATGIGGMIGNKGAVGISVLFGETSLLFINSHLAGNTEYIYLINCNIKLT